ncbi:MAG: ECF transporter S component [Clostridiales bacterium]|jgi:uncharacterized membrane protein|nr:ECF transporter S component [Clostridiales bacterium]
MQNVKAQSKSAVLRLCTAAMCLAAGILLPQLFHIPGVSISGQVFLPMHLPVFLCGLLCGWSWGAAVGVILPLISSAITSMPVMYPMGFSMMGELCAYGAVCGLLYTKVFSSTNKVWSIYLSLLPAMLAGRLVAGLIKWLLLMGTENPLTLHAFLTSSFITAWPGIIIQLILIPSIMLTFRKFGN